MIARLHNIVDNNSQLFPPNATQSITELSKLIDYDGVLIIASGPSASGKDQLILNCKENIERKGLSTDIIIKYSTRSKRPGEMSRRGQHHIAGHQLDRTAYYEFGDDAFEKKDDIFFMYEKYQHKYAFSKASLRNGKDINVQFLIFGDISKFSEFLQEIKKLTNRKIISLYLTVEEDTLYLRQIGRHFLTAEEREIRIREMRKDVHLLNNQHLLHRYDLALKNGKYDPLGHNEDIVVNEILKYVTHQ